MNEQSSRQSAQESKYEYPYHYIPTWDGEHFSQTQTLEWGYEYLSYLFFVLDKVTELGFESLLDVGCGDGRFLHEVSTRFPGRRLAGVDSSQRAVDYAAIMETSVEWTCGDITDQNILRERFDVVTLIETLEHIRPDQAPPFLEAIHGRLKETGSLIVTVPSSNTRVRQKHYRHFDLDSLTETLSPIFNVVQAHYLNRKPSLSLRAIRKCMVNYLFILNHRGILSRIYAYYVKNFLVAEADNCRRIAVICKKR